MKIKNYLTAKIDQLKIDIEDLEKSHAMQQASVFSFATLELCLTKKDFLRELERHQEFISGFKGTHNELDEALGKEANKFLTNYVRNMSLLAKSDGSPGQQMNQRVQFLASKELAAFYFQWASSDYKAAWKLLGLMM